MTKRVPPYSPEVRARAVRMVLDHQSEHPSQWSAINSIAEKIGCSGETLRHWVRQSERDQGLRPGATTDERGGRDRRGHEQRPRPGRRKRLAVRNRIPLFPGAGTRPQSIPPTIGRTAGRKCMATRGSPGPLARPDVRRSRRGFISATMQGDKTR